MAGEEKSKTTALSLFFIKEGITMQSHVLAIFVTLFFLFIFGCSSKSNPPDDFMNLRYDLSYLPGEVKVEALNIIWPNVFGFEYNSKKGKENKEELTQKFKTSLRNFSLKYFIKSFNADEELWDSFDSKWRLKAKKQNQKSGKIEDFLMVFELAPDGKSNKMIYLEIDGNKMNDFAKARLFGETMAVFMNEYEDKDN